MHYTEDDFSHSPLMFYYEVTQACDLICKHCRASAQAAADPHELSHEQSLALIDQVTTFPRVPIMVMTGGDPLKRADLFDLIRYAAGKGLQLALTPSATPLATREAFEKARDAGIQRLGISLDGADAKTHDAFRGWEGSFERTLIMLKNARELGLPVQVNTTITRRNFQQLDATGGAAGRPGNRHVGHVLSHSRSDAAWRSSGSRPKRWKRRSRNCGTTRASNPTASRPPKPRTIGVS